MRNVSFDEDYKVWASGASLVPFCERVSDSEEYNEDSENEELEKDEYGYNDIKKIVINFYGKNRVYLKKVFNA